eukprot:5200003-Pleurochrysis_carterae.AAC.2
MCERGRCICSDIRQTTQALGRHTGQARTPQQCCVRHGELGRRSSSSLAASNDIRVDALVLLADVYSNSSKLSGRTCSPYTADYKLRCVPLRSTLRVKLL